MRTFQENGTNKISSEDSRSGPLSTAVLPGRLDSENVWRYQPSTVLLRSVRSRLSLAIKARRNIMREDAVYSR
jgi:hypothetical protein